jgi:flagellar biosynthesis protein FlhB
MAGAMGVLAAQLAERVAVVAVALGLADYLWTRRRHMQGLRMTREEVTREHKESEGDPTHRAERQRLHRELAEQRMLADVRKADFVVVNPDHIAVALRYDRDGEAAPVVVARGERLLAERIRQAAREAGVPIFRDVTLARSLRHLAEGQEIPAALYEAVAEILRAVYAMGSADQGAAGTAASAVSSPPTSGTGTAATAAGKGAGAGWKRA